jgi:hypothetical protein
MGIFVILWYLLYDSQSKSCVGLSICLLGLSDYKGATDLSDEGILKLYKI